MNTKGSFFWSMTDNTNNNYNVDTLLTTCLLYYPYTYMLYHIYINITNCCSVCKNKFSVELGLDLGQLRVRERKSIFWRSEIYNVIYSLYV